MGITALIAGGIGAAGSIGSAIIGSNASKNASNAQVTMQQQALQQQKEMYGKAENVLSPYANAGASVLPTLKSLITPGADQSAVLAQTPGFQFQSQYGTKAATNALAARGLGASAGPLATAISQYNQGLAGTTWQSVVNSLQGYANMGQGSATSLANAAIGSGNAQAGTLSNIGQSQAQGILGSANAISGGIQGVGNSLSSAMLFNALGSGGGGGGIYGNLSGAAYGGGNVFTDAWGGSKSNPLPGLDASDYAAEGGHTDGGGARPIVVGENGPELFWPDGAGTIIPYERVRKAMKNKNCLTTRGLDRRLGVAA